MMWSDEKRKEKQKVPQEHTLSSSAKFAQRISTTADEFPVKTLADRGAKTQKKKKV